MRSSEPSLTGRTGRPDSVRPIELDVRTITEDEVPAWCAALNTGFLNPVGDVDAEARRAGLFLDRTWGGFDGDRIVATLRSFPTRMTVPGGGSVAASALTAVTTTSTHRRRGLASRLIAGEMAAAVERGEQAGVLIAAEWGIYGRFGFGAATEHQAWTVDAAAARVRQVPGGTVEFVDRDTARALAPDVYRAHWSNHPGEIERPTRFWDIDFGILRYPSQPDPKPCFHVIARSSRGSVIGVARYECEEKWEGRQPRGEITVTMFVTAEPAADALLWHHLLTLDLVARVKIADRGPDEILPWLLVDARDAQPIDRSDFLWVRPLDLSGLLAARTYSSESRVVLDVIHHREQTGRRVALDGGPGGATCETSEMPPDLTMSISTLSSIYLGGYGLSMLAGAGLVEEHTAGAVAMADAMFRSPVTPWCSTWF